MRVDPTISDMLSGPEESDEPDTSSHAIQNLLADLNMPAPSTQFSHAQLPLWTFPASTSSRDISSPHVAETTNQGSVFSSRPVPRVHAVSAPDVHSASSNPTSQQPSQFTTPNRSIFSSGPPTSSLSANTAQASMSTPPPVSSAHPLSTLAVPSSTSNRRSVHYQSDVSSSSRKTRTTRVEKDVDDPLSVVEPTRLGDRGGTGTPTALTRLFTTPEVSSPTLSRHASYFRTPSGTGYTRAILSETAPLPSHLYNRGLLNGKHSDIKVHAFGTKYALHRLLLDRAPFFSSALSEPWFESSSNDITLHPDDVDFNITQAAFELALKRLYGCGIAAEEDKEAIGLFATGCWLEMADLIDSSVNAILRQMSPERLGLLIRLVTSNYYGKPGDRILESAKSMLCREGWQMPIRYWDAISGEIAREIIGGDGFFVPGEWERWVLAKRVLDRKLKVRAIEVGLLGANGKFTRPPPDNINFSAIRFDTVYRNTSAVPGRNMPEAYDSWLAVYTSPDIAALLVLLDEGIHYIHLSFEQLQDIRERRDVLGLPVMPEKVISNALWMSMELRQRIVNAKELDMELGLAFRSEESLEQPAPDSATLIKSSNSTGDARGKGKQIELVQHEDEEDEMDSGSWDGNGKPRKFWIPHVDHTSVSGGNPESIVATTSRPHVTRHFSQLSGTIDPQDVQWASDFTASMAERPQTPGRSHQSEPVQPIHYTHYPPFRFAAEFPNPRNLKEKKRVYSRTVWYAGSLWNVYIQKVETTKNTQLGVYLHRAKEKEGHEDLRHGSVDERIGQVEMLMRRNERQNRRQTLGEPRADPDEDTSNSSGDPDATLVPGNPNPADSLRVTALSNLLRGDGITKSSQSPGTLTLANLPDRAYNAAALNSDNDDNDDPIDKAGKDRVPALPPYVDGRPTIKTYFKIYSPSKGGRMLSLYESAPDHFNFSQSWGWKSSTMILDDGLLGYEDVGGKKDGRLRFMVVIGMFLLSMVVPMRRLLMSTDRQCVTKSYDFAD